MLQNLVFVFALIYISSAGRADIDTNITQNEGLTSVFVAVTSSDTSFGDDEPYFEFDFILESPRPPTFSMVLFHTDRKQLIGQAERLWCCTHQLSEMGQCKEGELFIKNKDALQFSNALSSKYLVDTDMKIYFWNSFQTYPMSILDGQTVTKANERIEIEPSGTWYLVVAQCQSNQSEHVNGTLEFGNPWGYLSGNSFSNLPVYLTLASSYFGMFLVWLCFITYYRIGLMGLQHAITVTILIALAETLLWAIYFTYYNFDGMSLYGVNVMGALLNAMKVTSIRTLILLVSLGYSITRPHLSLRTVVGIFLLTFFYLLAEAIHEYIFVGKYIGVIIPSFLEYTVITLLSALNFLYIIWAGYALNTNMIFLRAKHQLEKLSLYKVFAVSLLVFLSISTVCYVLQITFQVANYMDQAWQFWWVWNAYWQFSYLLLTLVIAFLWRPNGNNKRYAYFTEITQDDKDKIDDELSGDVQLKGIPHSSMDRDDSSDAGGSADGESYDTDQLDQLVL